MANLFAGLGRLFRDRAAKAPLVVTAPSHPPRTSKPAPEHKNGHANGHAAAAVTVPVRKHTGRGGDRNPNNMRWSDYPEADRMILERYPNTNPATLVVMLAPLIPGRRITENMVIGRANRLQTRRRKKSESGES